MNAAAYFSLIPLSSGARREASPVLLPKRQPALVLLVLLLLLLLLLLLWLWKFAINCRLC